jgi:hypothetical protein
MKWKDKRHVNIMTNMLSPPAAENFYDKNGKSLTPAMVKDYNRPIEYEDKYDHMINLYSIRRQP